MLVDRIATYIAIPARKALTRSVTFPDDGQIQGNGALGGVQVGSINITVENTGEQLSPAAQKQIANQVQGIVMSTLVNERRSGGLLR
jgi:hypothetical protein